MQGYRKQKNEDSRPGSHPTESQNVMDNSTAVYFEILTMRLITSEVVVLPPLCIVARIAVTSMVMLSFPLSLSQALLLSSLLK